MPKYKREQFVNDDETYFFLFEMRDLEKVVQFTNKQIPKRIKNLNISVFNYTWRQGDKLYKLAAKFYGSHKLWWIIALANKISCEADLSYGDVIIVPTTTKQILEAFSEQ